MSLPRTGAALALMLTLMPVSAGADDTAPVGQMAEITPALPAATLDRRFHPIGDSLDLAVAEFPNGKTLALSLGLGSSLMRRADAPADEVWALTDRGPNIPCKATEWVMGVPPKTACNGETSAKVFPMPDYTPTLVHLKLTDQGMEVLKKLPLKTSAGDPVTGLPNPFVSTDTENAYDKDGQALPLNPNGMDPEGLVQLSDGTFWIAEEYGPSLAHVSADGTVLERLVPSVEANDLKDADYEIRPTLPAILAKRKLNRGFESLAVSADETRLFALLQSPLANPDKKAYANSRNVRLLEISLPDGQPVAEYVYVMDKPDAFGKDAAKKTPKQSAVKISEMRMLPDGSLLVLERVSATTRLFRVTVPGTNILGGKWDDASTRPTLENTPDLKKAGVVPLEKNLVLDTDVLTDVPEKIEGIALMPDNTLALVNDNDFGIYNTETQILTVTPAKPLSPAPSAAQ